MVSLPNIVQREQFVQTLSLYKVHDKLSKDDEGRASKSTTIFNFIHPSMFMTDKLRAAKDRLMSPLLQSRLV